jgi:hypothetical protein
MVALRQSFRLRFAGSRALAAGSLYYCFGASFAVRHGHAVDFLTCLAHRSSLFEPRIARSGSLFCRLGLPALDGIVDSLDSCEWPRGTTHRGRWGSDSSMVPEIACSKALIADDVTTASSQRRGLCDHVDAYRPMSCVPIASTAWRRVFDVRLKADAACPIVCRELIELKRCDE